MVYSENQFTSEDGTPVHVRAPWHNGHDSTGSVLIKKHVKSDDILKLAHTFSLTFEQISIYGAVFLWQHSM